MGFGDKITGRKAERRLSDMHASNEGLEQTLRNAREDGIKTQEEQRGKSKKIQPPQRGEAR